jgi:pimeloyl-ACP methyl ester carboxylesterase
MTSVSGANPDSIGAPPPTVDRVNVGDVALHVESRGSGAPVLIIGAADEDAEVYRGIAERLAETNTVLTYDRRGSGRSGRDGWPADSNRHADDAASLISSLGHADVTVLGTSAGGVVALRLALRHPDRLKAVLCFEPGVFAAVEEGQCFRARIEGEVVDHLARSPHDWLGAVEALGRAAVTDVADMTSLFTPPPGKEWFSLHTSAGAEALIRGDLPMTAEPFDAEAVQRCPLNLRFSHGTRSLPIFRRIAETLAASRDETPDVLSGVGHSIFYHPDEAVEYLRRTVEGR